MNTQRGAALLVALLVLILAVTTGLLSAFNGRNSQAEREKITDAALAQAKAALIAYATSVRLDSGSARPGDLPCPDTNNDGMGETSCGNASGTTKQIDRLGRLPWKTLGLPDLRDGNGERLWYAVSTNYKNNTRTPLLNSDTLGTISIRDPAGNILRDAQAGQGVVAVIIAPGAVLSRPNSVSDATPYGQSRDTASENNAKNYLDLAFGEDNADFDEITDKQNGFISGPIRDANGNIIMNDRLIWITPEEIALALGKRVIAEVSQCLREYGQDPGNAGRYPWAATDTSFSDAANTRFGRLPDTPFTATCTSSGGTINFSDKKCIPGTSPTPMSSGFVDGGNCNINSISGWWLNWKELVFYAVAEQQQPAPTAPIQNCGQNGFAGLKCISINGQANRQFTVLVAGKTLIGQTRSSGAQMNDPANYLEGGNATSAPNFVSAAPGNFNDLLRAFP